MTSFYRLAGLAALVAASFSHPSAGQRNETKATDSDTPLHLLQPDYPVPYGKISPKKRKSCSSASTVTWTRLRPHN